MLHPYQYEEKTPSCTRPIAESFSQDSALRRTLFLIFMNSTGDAVLNVDEVVLWQQDWYIDKATEVVNRDLASLKCFCERGKMQKKKKKNTSSDQECEGKYRDLVEAGRNKIEGHSLVPKNNRALIESTNAVLNLDSMASLKKLDKVQTTALRLIFGSCREYTNRNPGVRTPK
ncbi:hypothetical protein PoB_004340100 [Plakobranchus ocellatus]|uniref:Uncharacterized protein n=1 Tax=Plakobranchus ocellatus TaxID=259542 RepID=A0AAV4B8Y1_9GAST|nr:hypothetical protein PoB_004340100 [Plakobranchus ocellatus]